MPTQDELSYLQKNMIDLLAQKEGFYFSDAFAMEGGEDFSYFSDPQTYELYYLNQAALEILGIKADDYRGKTCYEILQGRDTPCPFCTNARLSREQYYVWEFYNAKLGRRYILRDKLIEWKGKVVRMESAIDVTNDERVTHTLMNSVENQSRCV